MIVGYSSHKYLKLVGFPLSLLRPVGLRGILIESHIYEEVDHRETDVTRP